MNANPAPARKLHIEATERSQSAPLSHTEKGRTTDE